MNSRVFYQGRPADADTLAALALVNYGHFTTMQVRDGAVRGLDLHLERLQQGNVTLFGGRLDEAALRFQLTTALDAFGANDASMRITAFSRVFDFRAPLREVPVDLVVSFAAPSLSPTTALRVRPVAFVRALPHVKHVGTFPLFQLRREAIAAGFDDALFVDARGYLVEGSVWNLGLWDGQSVTWPKGPALAGIQEQLLRVGLDRLGVPQQIRAVHLDELGCFSAAFACNSRGHQPIAAVGASLLPQSGLPDVLDQAMATQPWQPIRQP